MKFKTLFLGALLASTMTLADEDTDAKFSGGVGASVYTIQYGTHDGTADSETLIFNGTVQTNGADHSHATIADNALVFGADATKPFKGFNAKGAVTIAFFGSDAEDVFQMFGHSSNSGGSDIETLKVTQKTKNIFSFFLGGEMSGASLGFTAHRVSSELIANFEGGGAAVDPQGSEQSSWFLGGDAAVSGQLSDSISGEITGSYAWGTTKGEDSEAEFALKSDTDSVLKRVVLLVKYSPNKDSSD